MTKILNLNPTPVIGYITADELVGAEMPYPKKWDGAIKPEELGRVISGYHQTKYVAFLNNFNENVSNILKRYDKETPTEIAPKLTEEVKKLIKWMFTTYPQFSQYRLAIANFLMMNSQIFLYLLVTEELVLVNEADKSFTINPVQLSREFMGDDAKLGFKEFNAKLTLGV